MLQEGAVGGCNGGSGGYNIGSYNGSSSHNIGGYTMVARSTLQKQFYWEFGVTIVFALYLRAP